MRLSSLAPPRSFGANIEQKPWTAYGGWFLTGEQAPYSAQSGVLSRPHVLRPLGQGGAGVFELLARYDDFDLKDAARAARTMRLRSVLPGIRSIFST